MDKTRDSTNSKIWTDSTCAISVRRKGQILLVVESLVLSTTFALPKHIPQKTFMESNSSWQETTKSLGQMSIDVLFKKRRKNKNIPGRLPENSRRRFQ